MSMMIEHPGWAWLAAVIFGALVAAVATGRRNRGLGSRSWRWVLAGVILPWGAATCVALAMAGTSVVLREDAGVVILLDFSASTRGSPWRDPAWVRLLAEKRLGPDRRVMVVGFGAGGDLAGQRVLLEGARPGQISAWPVAWPSEATAALEAQSARLAQTNVPAAVAWRAPGEREGSQERAGRWVITDGLFSRQAVMKAGDAAPLAWTIVPPQQADVAVTDLVVRAAGGPSAASRGAGMEGGSAGRGVEILAQLRAVAPAGGPQDGGTSAAEGRVVQAEVEITRDGTRIASQPVEFHFSPEDYGRQGMVDRTRWISARDELDADGGKVPHRYEVRVKPARAGAQAGVHDLWPEDDAGSVVWAAPEKMRVLVVGDGLPAGLGESEASDWVIGRVDARHFGGDVRELSAGGWQVIVLKDVPAGEEGQARGGLSPEAAKGIDRFVREMGGGLLILSDEHAFGPGHYGEGSLAGDILEELSPFWSHPHRGESLKVVFVIDASASMNEAVASGPAGVAERKFRVLAGGVAGAAALLSNEDRLTVITFNDRARTLISGKAGEARSSLAQVLAGVQPAGATVPDTALEPLAGALQDEQGRAAVRRLVVFVTDGEIPAMDVARWKALLAPDSGNVGPVELCLVAPAPARGVSDSLPAMLAREVPGTRWFMAQDAGAWAGLLHEAVAEHVRGRVAAMPLDWQYQAAAGSTLAGRARSWTTVWLKPESTLVAEGRPASGEARESKKLPLAAIVQRGLGKAGAVAVSDADGAAESAAYVSMRRDMIQRVAAGPGDRRFHVTARKDEGGGWQVSADGVEPASEAGGAEHFLDGQKLVLRLLSAEGEGRREIALAQSAPGHYEGHAEVAGALCAAIVREGGAGANAGDSLVARVQSADVQSSEWPAAVGSSMIPREGVILSPAPAEAGMWNPAVERSIGLTDFLWGAAIGAALGALFVRRG